MFEDPSPGYGIADEGAEDRFVWVDDEEQPTGFALQDADDDLLRRSAFVRHVVRVLARMDDVESSSEARGTRRAVQVSTRKYKARRKRKR